jgi:hypothetical protein
MPYNILQRPLQRLCLVPRRAHAFVRTVRCDHDPGRLAAIVGFAIDQNALVDAG